ncbi:MAG TPA: 30S ribosomal protein S10 [Candidatus Dojkabacteria bacterium]|nr:30S ribosomal protein S10 [Candidatus Dojkabacteria bacterium]HQG57830.1 30S ribosomal protein S10 [Candidatus Dojkabacteria bacterium]
MAAKQGLRIRVKLQGYDSAVLDSSAKSIMETAVGTGAKVAGPIPFPTECKRYAIKRSPFIYKGAFEHFEMKVHKRIVDIVDPTPKTIESLQHLQVPAGVDIQIK